MDSVECFPTSSIDGIVTKNGFFDIHSPTNLSGYLTPYKSAFTQQMSLFFVEEQLDDIIHWNGINYDWVQRLIFGVQ